MLAVVACVAASVVRWIETATGADTLVAMSPEASRTFLGAIAGTMVTATIVVFWVRGLIVSTHAGRVPNRILSDYLADRYQQWVMGTMVGAFTFSAVGMVALSVGGAEAEADAAGGLVVVVAAILSVGALLIIVQSIDSGVRAMHEERLLRRVLESAFEVIERDYPEHEDGPDRVGDPPPIDRSRARVVRSTEIGWVRAIDEGRLLQELPDGSTCWLESRVGAFVSPATALCLLDGADDLDPGVIEQAFDVVDSRDPHADLALALRNLVDVALGSLIDGTDRTTGREAVAHLGALMRPIIAWDGPARVLTGTDGQCLVRGAEPDFAHFVQEAFEDLGRVSDPLTARYTLSVLDDLIEVADESGRSDRAELLRRRAASVVEQVRTSGATDDEVTLLREQLAG